MPARVEARKLTKCYASLPAVDQVSFSIRPGELLGCIGRNGSGKSTIVKMLVGLLEPTFGEVLFEGVSIGHNQTGYKRRLGYVPEEANLYAFLTGWEYLELVATLRRMNPKRFEEKASAMLEALTMFPHRGSLIASYSKGMRQRIVLIAAMLDDPDVLVLDEPFSGLDVSSALVVRKVIQRLAEEGKAVFFSSPVLEVVEKLCSHLIILRRGSIVASGSMDKVRAGSGATPGLEDAFLEWTEHVDADQIANNIVAAVRAPGR